MTTVVAKEQPVLQSPDGREIKLPQEVFDVLWQFVNEHRRTGTITVEMKTGGVVGVVSNIRHK